MSSHDFALCRALYQQARQAGSPVIHVLATGSDYYVAESADGALLSEGVSGCCKWAMKYDLASQWLSTRKNKPLIDKASP